MVALSSSFIHFTGIGADNLDNNEFNRRIRYALRLDDAETLRLMSLGGLAASEEAVAGYRCKEGEDGHLACPDAALLALLDGLVLDRRGPPPARAGNAGGAGTTGAQGGDSATGGKAADETRAAVLSNNLVLKQLRIALSLRSDDVYELIKAGGGKIGKTEVSAFFRNPLARNYRRCGDQGVRWFLNGLTARRDV